MMENVTPNKTTAGFASARVSNSIKSQPTKKVHKAVSTGKLAKSESEEDASTDSDTKYISKLGSNPTISKTTNAGRMQFNDRGQAEKAFKVISTFISGILAISASQMIGIPLRYADPDFYKRYIAGTKESFAILMTMITQVWAPTKVNVSGDESMKGQLYHMDDGSLRCNFPHRLVLMANHQLYTDWLYIWWIAYTNKMHGGIYMIMKESLRYLPLLGWAAQVYKFIFLSRKWEADKPYLKNALNQLKQPDEPMWLVIFPEGTNLSATTREESSQWAVKSGIPDMRHQLLPRTTGLQFCLQELKQTTNWLYDCTIAYEGIPKGQYGQDVFTLKASFLEGRPPQSVNLYWRRFKISEIPVNDNLVFSRWLLNRWREKDYVLEYFEKFKCFPANDAVTALRATQGKVQPKHAKMISTEIKGQGWVEFLRIFEPLTDTVHALTQTGIPKSLKLEAFIEAMGADEQSDSILREKGRNNRKSVNQASKSVAKKLGPNYSKVGERTKELRNTKVKKPQPFALETTATIQDRASKPNTGGKEC